MRIDAIAQSRIDIPAWERIFHEPLVFGSNRLMLFPFKSENQRPEAFVFGTETGRKTKCVKTAWHLACCRAGIEGLSIHELRREAASSLHESGMPLAYGWQFLGHAQLATTSEYIQASRLGCRNGSGASSQVGTPSGNPFHNRRTRLRLSKVLQAVSF